MQAKVGDTVHPKYGGSAGWRIERIARLDEYEQWDDPIDGKVIYDPKILWLSCPKYRKVLWFAYWIATSNTNGELEFGQRPPMLEENAFFNLLSNAIKQGFFNEGFLKKLKHEIEALC